MAAPTTGLTGNLQTIVNALQQLTVQVGNLIQQIATSTSSIFVQSTGTASTATAGAAGAPPAQVEGYITVNIPGVGLAKVPYYKP
jgi:hypothetical protein